MIDISADTHVHTRLCHHARGEMEDYVLSAIENGLRKLVFLEHLEAGINYFETTWLSQADFAYYLDEGKRLQDKYGDRLEIGLGIEVGYNPTMTDEILRRLSLYSWDVIGISYHFLATRDSHLNLVSRRQSNIDELARLGIQNVVKKYYENLLAAVEKLPGTVLCHMDAVLRHHPDAAPLAENDELVDELLDALAGKKMALEVNTSGFSIRGEPYPSVAILQKAIEKKTPLTAGSDAHRPEDVGRHFDRLAGLIEKIGER